MQVRCYRCSWGFDLKQEEATAALKSLEESGGKHYDVHCPRCRSVNKIPVAQLRRSLPRVAAPEPKPPEPPPAES
jgi:phage FluMu protein Com